MILIYHVCPSHGRSHVSQQLSIHRHTISRYSYLVQFRRIEIVPSICLCLGDPLCHSRSCIETVCKSTCQKLSLFRWWLWSRISGFSSELIFHNWSSSRSIHLQLISTTICQWLWSNYERSRWCPVCWITVDSTNCTESVHATARESQSWILRRITTAVLLVEFYILASRSVTFFFAASRVSVTVLSYESTIFRYVFSTVVLLALVDSRLSVSLFVYVVDWSAFWFSYYRFTASPGYVPLAKFVILFDAAFNASDSPLLPSANSAVELIWNILWFSNWSVSDRVFDSSLIYDYNCYVTVVASFFVAYAVLFRSRSSLICFAVTTAVSGSLYWVVILIWEKKSTESISNCIE